ncbi:hypothetical protein A3197_11025 [Candidatus Thiodiazotropha endoloripes]|nr:hypothetical protein A3197_11025 [Candidatus Thiodiazotropha endoloripes]
MTAMSNQDGQTTRNYSGNALIGTGIKLNRLSLGKTDLVASTVNVDVSCCVFFHRIQLVNMSISYMRVCKPSRGHRAMDRCIGSMDVTGKFKWTSPVDYHALL